MTVPSRPILRYHGGKWRLAPWIISFFPEHRCYVEPFGGGGSVLLQKDRSYAEVYNDLDSEVVNLFRVVREKGEQLATAVELTPFSREEFDLTFERAEDDMERARRFLLRSHAGFGTAALRSTVNGIPQRTGFRANTTRRGTTPAGDWRGFHENVTAVVERMRGVVIENRDATIVMLAHDSEQTLHYVDPPYVHETRGHSARWNYRHEMTDDDHRRLAVTLTELRGMVILSGYDSPLYDDLYADWHRVERATHADGARDRTEVLWMRNVPINQPELFC